LYARWLKCDTKRGSRTHHHEGGHEKGDGSVTRRKRFLCIQDLTIAVIRGAIEVDDITVDIQDAGY
jgi:hypothetical protein